MTTLRFTATKPWLVLLLGLVCGSSCSGSAEVVDESDSAAGSHSAAGNGAGGGSWNFGFGGGLLGDGGDAGMRSAEGGAAGEASGSRWMHAAGSSMPARYEHAVRVFNGRLFLVGGTSESVVPQSDVWSTDDGSSWSLVTEDAGFGGRANHAMAVLGDKLWVVGGSAPSGKLNDVWSSTDGATWRQATSAAGFEVRQNHCLEAFAGKLWVIAGAGSQPLGDVWSSADGVT